MRIETQRTIGRGEDPVCGMVLDAAAADGERVVLRHGDVGYSFCSPGCLVEFRDDPAWFLDPAYTPTPM